MAIYNGEKIVVPSNKANATSIEKLLYIGFEEVREMFEKFKVPGVDPTSILLTRDFEKKWNRKKTSWKPAPPINFPLVANIYDETVGSVQLRYASSPPQRVEKRLIWNREKEIDMFFESMVLTSNRLDLAWFLLKGTNYLKNGMYRIIDTKAEYSAKFDEVLLEKSVTNLLFEESVTEEQIAKVATLFFKDGELDFKAVSGQKEMTMRLYNSASVNTKAKKKPGFKELHAMCELMGLNDRPKETEDVKEEVLMFKGTPEQILIPLKKKPAKMRRQDLYDEAEKLGFAPGNVKDDVLFTMVEYYREKVDTT